MSAGRSDAYDLDNRLTGAVIGGTPIIYDYDVAGRRVGKSVGGEETRFLHAGDMEIAEYADDGTLLRRYIPGGSVDARVAMIEGSTTVPGDDDIRYYHADRLGNVAALTDGNGRVTDRYAYDPFGNEITGAATSGNPFRYTGRRYDPETGLYLYRARYYDAPLGRFLQTDPIGYADQWNLYTYVGNNPLNATDPDGRDAQAVVVGNHAHFHFNIRINPTEINTSRFDTGGAQINQQAAIADVQGGIAKLNSLSSTGDLSASFSASISVDNRAQGGRTDVFNYGPDSPANTSIGSEKNDAIFMVQGAGPAVVGHELPHALGLPNTSGFVSSNNGEAAQFATQLGFENNIMSLSSSSDRDLSSFNEITDQQIRDMLGSSNTNVVACFSEELCGE